MVTKTEAVQQIIEIMKDNGISVAEINSAIKAMQRPVIDETFDLLCEINGVKQRMPFDTGKNLNPIAIFPRKDQKFFLELDESGMIAYPPESEKDSLPDEVLVTLIMPVRPEMNEKLRELGKPLFSGMYWLNGHEHSGIGYWMAIVRDDQQRVDYYDASRRAKVRRIGHI